MSWIKWMMSGQTWKCQSLPDVGLSPLSESLVQSTCIELLPQPLNLVPWGLLGEGDEDMVSTETLTYQLSWLFFLSQTSPLGT